MMRKKYLSKSEMFGDPYCHSTIGQLLQNYRLEIERCPLGNYRNYTPTQLIEHYKAESMLARQLMGASRTARKKLYTTLYDELFLRVPYHPRLLRMRQAEAAPTKAVRKPPAFLEKLLNADSSFLEIGPGDYQLAFEVAKRVKKVYAVDISDEITKNCQLPHNFELILSDGSSVDVPPESITIAYSNQVMEHIHPEDAVVQLESIYRALAPGGIYICMTPHRFGGPADVSRFFHEDAHGFHFKEYTNGELLRLFKAAGFSQIFSMKRIYKTAYFHVHLWPMLALENALHPLSHSQRRRVYRFLKRILAIRFIAQK